MRRRRLPLLEITRDEFRLPRLEPVLDAMLDELEGGRGFQVLRGLPVWRYTAEEAEIIYWGLGNHLGTAVTQNYEGHLMGHVRDLKPDQSDPRTRGYHSKRPLKFHSDSSDVVALLCYKQAKSGGESILVSSMTLHNVMLAERPDLLRVLYEPFYLDRKGEERPGRAPCYPLSVFHAHDGMVTARYNRSFIETSQRFPEVPRHTAKQIEALDYLDALSEREDLRMEMLLEEGDIQWLNNYVVLHGRRDYEDHEQFEEKRHLLRLWLTMREGRRLPPAFKKMYGAIEPGLPRTGFEGMPGRFPS